MVLLRWIAVPLLALACACAGQPIESASAGSGASDASTSADDEGASATASTTVDATTITTGSSADTTTTTTDSGTAATTSGETTTGKATESTGTGDTGEMKCHPQLSEIAFDVAGMDDELEWIAIYNPCEDAVLLDDYALGWGGVDYTYGKQQLSGSLASHACFVIGGPQANNSNYDPVFDQLADFEMDLQNAGNDADAIGLFSGGPDDIVAESVPLDAVIYGEANTSMLLDETGRIGDVDIVPGTDMQTIARVIDGGDWVVVATPSPNDCTDPA